MSDFFKGLKAVSGEVVSKSLNLTAEIQISFRGEFDLIRGLFVQTFTYWTNQLSENRYGFIAVEDDWEYNEQSATLDELPIDRIDNFKDTLRQGGLSTLAKSLEFTEDEKRQAMFSAIENSQEFKNHFGKKAKSWELLSSEEQEMVKLKFVIDNYDTCSDYDKRNFGIVSLDENNEKVPNYVPTLVELTELRDLRLAVK